jgi:hypothetical protein
MSPGDEVIHLRDPLGYGRGTYEWLTADGRLAVRFERRGICLCDPFDVELWHLVMATPGRLVTGDDLRSLLDAA